jgi:hypothetical protein
MVTIQHLVEKIIEQKPFLQEALSKGIVNNAALAEELRPQIETELKKKVKFSAVNMAIRRLAEKLEKSFVVKTKFDEETNVIVQSDLIEVVVYKTEEVQKQIKQLYDLVDFRKGDFLTITQGLHEVMIITNKKFEKKIKFPKKSVKKVINKLNSLTINIPETAVETVGLFYIVARALNWENINIVDIVSTFTEMTFIVNENDTSKAFDTLKKLIEGNR